MRRKGWCIGWDRDGETVWCRATGDSPDRGEFQHPTVCGYWITVNQGIKKRLPTCPDCLAVLRDTDETKEM